MDEKTTDLLAGIPEPDRSRIKGDALRAWDESYARHKTDGVFTARQIADEAYKSALSAGVAAYHARQMDDGHKLDPEAAKQTGTVDGLEPAAMTSESHAAAPSGAVWTGSVELEDETCPIAVAKTGDKYQPMFYGLGRWRHPAPEFGYEILAAWAGQPSSDLLNAETRDDYEARLAGTRPLDAPPAEGT